MFFKKKITVVLPVYNGELYLKDSIESVLNQSHKDFELIIVDDCSTDQTSVIAQQYQNKYNNVFYTRNENNLKLPEALNKGFSLASGDYWTWTSCDNIYLPNAFERLTAELDFYSEVGLVYSDMETIDELGHLLGYVHAGVGDDLIFRNIVGACFLYRASIAKQAGVYNKEKFLCEDYEYWLRLACITKLKPINEALYRYRYHSKSLSHNNEKMTIVKGIAVQKHYYRSFVDTRKKAALFYAHLRARDIYNPFRQFYLFIVLFFSPLIFLKEIYGLIVRRFEVQ